MIWLQYKEIEKFRVRKKLEVVALTTKKFLVYAKLEVVTLKSLVLTFRQTKNQV